MERTTASEKNDPAHPWPIPLPKRVRTRRAGPRLGAAVVLAAAVLIWLTCYPRLRAADLPALVLFSDLLVFGDNHFAIVPVSRPDSCVGRLTATLEGGTIMRLSGEMGTKDRKTIRLKGHSGFSSYKWAEEIGLEILFPHFGLSLSGNKEDPGKIRFKTSRFEGGAVSVVGEETLKRPQPMLLIPKGERDWAFTIPPSAQYALRRNFPGVAALAPLRENLMLKRVAPPKEDAAEKDVCSDPSKLAYDQVPLSSDEIWKALQPEVPKSIGRKG